MFFHVGSVRSFDHPHSDRTKKSRSLCRLSRTVNGFTSIRDSCVGVCVLEGSRARSPHELARPERLIFSVIAVDLPTAQTAAGIHNLPSITAKHFLHIRRLGLDNRTMAQNCRALTSSQRKSVEPKLRLRPQGPIRMHMNLRRCNECNCAH